MSTVEYFAEAGAWFACASQPAALLRVPGVEPDVNRRYAALIAGSHYRTFDNAAGDAPFASMHQVPAAHYVEVTGRSVRPGRYWSLEESPLAGSDERMLAEQYRDLLLAAVKRFRAAIS